eukprot:CAMPEP_0202866864 /NCGR_PEP_ID=MMETSP1391-20130828/8401_1 /ASSEMBLY_ACC=CAM_ASM_000867 /TAXON_ID=1034604 /ORGANISM="Chlamydomonas leiostraca, Strain SAG 11-49" /LENGTH=235 /DNA_ID=CAMNT_0049546851 /DNA_START=51 /DNA_END=758 /DNA_ORIENTATION=+
MAQATLVVLLAAFVACAYAADSVAVTCGSTIKLQHIGTQFRLHSHEVAYARGSQQQSVTCYPTGDDANSLWILLGTSEKPCVPGDTVKKGQAVRLQHVATRKWLHSHRFQSPLSGNLEVSAFGSESQTDGGDIWSVEWEGKHRVWRQETKIRLKHRDTGAFLYSHQAQFGNPIAGQLEVCAMERKDKNSEWQAAEGVYLPVNPGKKKESGDGKDGNDAADASKADGGDDDGKEEL